jgi:hypothetical protein
MRTRRVAMIAAVLLPLSVAGPAATGAPDAKHGSCERFGQSFAAWARGELPAEFGSPGTVAPVLAQSEPGAVATFLHLEMTEEVEGIPGTPLCDPHPRNGN